MTSPPNPDLATNTRARVGQKNRNDPLDLHGHVDEKGVRFKTVIEIVGFYKLPVAWKMSVLDMEAVGIVPLLVPDKSMMFP